MKKSLPQVDEVAKKSQKSRKFAKMAKSDGLNKVGDKNLIFQNDRLATATQKIKKNAKKSTNRICKKYKYTQIPTKIGPRPGQKASGRGRRPPGRAKGPRAGPKAPPGGLWPAKCANWSREMTGHFNRPVR